MYHPCPHSKHSDDHPQRVAGMHYPHRHCVVCLEDKIRLQKRCKIVPLTGLDLHFCPMGKNNGSPRSSPRRQRSSALHSMGSSPYPHNKKSETPTGSRFSWCRCSVAVPCIFGGGQSRLENTDRCHSLGSLPLPPAALPSLPGLSPTVRSPTDTRKASPLRAGFSGAVDGTRTRTVSPPGDFKSPVSTIPPQRQLY